MNRKKTIIIALSIVLVMLLGFISMMFLFNPTEKRSETVMQTQYTWMDLPESENFKIIMSDKRELSYDQYKLYVESKGFTNKEDKIAFIEPITIKSGKSVKHVKVGMAETIIVLTYRGEIVQGNEVLSLDSELDFSKYKVDVHQTQFDTLINLDNPALVEEGSIDFSVPGNYDMSYSYSDDYGNKVSQKWTFAVGTAEEGGSASASDETILVTRTQGLSPDYVPDLVEIPSDYAVSAGYRATQNTTQQFIEMVDAMYKETGMWMYVTSSYRSYERQEELYWGYVEASGQAEADRYSAKPGHSEHQTGLVVDVVTPGGVMDDFGLTQQSAWVQANAHNYGFIVRYPEGKESITGYMPEAWHLRYIGSIAKDVYESGLTYDEWYAQHLE